MTTQILSSSAPSALWKPSKRSTGQRFVTPILRQVNTINQVFRTKTTHWLRSPTIGKNAADLLLSRENLQQSILFILTKLSLKSWTKITTTYQIRRKVSYDQKIVTHLACGLFS